MRYLAGVCFEHIFEQDPWILSFPQTVEDNSLSGTYSRLSRQRRFPLRLFHRPTISFRNLLRPETLGYRFLKQNHFFKAAPHLKADIATPFLPPKGLPKWSASLSFSLAFFRFSPGNWLIPVPVAVWRFWFPVTLYISKDQNQILPASLFYFRGAYHVSDLLPQASWFWTFAILIRIPCR